MAAPPPARVLTRYALHDPFAAGGMASVHFGFLLGPAGFTRPVAIKRMHAELARDPQLASMFIDEARLAARVRHPNVVPTLDVVAEEGEVLLVMEYVAGESLAQLLRAASARREPVRRDVLAAIFVGVLDGLHAAHEATNERGEPLGLVHRDVSPQNVLVGLDGVARVLDFGIAKAEGRAHTTRDGRVKGKLAYLAPEQLEHATSRASDVYSVGVCLWEALTLHRLFDADNPSVVVAKISAGIVPPPSAYAADVPPSLEAIVLRALARDPAARFATAHAMARAIEGVIAPAPASAVAAWVDALVGEKVRARGERIAAIERERAAGAASVARVDASPSAAAPSAAASAARADAVIAPAPDARRDSVTRATPRRAVAAIALAVVGIGATAAIAASLRRAPAAAGRVATDAAVVATPTPTPTSIERSPAAAASSASTLDDASAPSARAPVHVAPTQRVPRAMAAPAPPSPARSAPGPSATAPANDCDPPYTVDSEGVRHYRRSCFK